MKCRPFKVVTLCLLSFLGTMAIDAKVGHAGEAVRIGGTGMGLAAMRLLGEDLQQQHPDVSVQVLPSLGTPGGIEALADGAIDIAIASRPLKPPERDKGVREASCMTTAMVFVSSHPRPGGIELLRIPELYSNPSPTWPDGTPLKIILRSRTGSEHPYLIQAIPGMEKALEAAFARPGIPVGATDQENVDLAQHVPGSLSVATLMQIAAERPGVRMLALDGVQPTVDTVEDGSYPFPLRVCLLLPTKPSPDAVRFIAFANSEEGRQRLRRFGAVLSENPK